MPNDNAPEKSIQDQKKHTGIVILVEDQDRIAPQEDAKKLSIETGFPIVKRHQHKVFIKALGRAKNKGAKVAGKLAAKNKAAKSNNKQATEKATLANDDPNSTKPIDDIEWQLVYTSEGLALRLSNEPSWGDILVDFNSAALNYRKQHGGGRNEALAKAIGIKGKELLTVIDCTAGMGNDSFVMASVGAHVTMLERSPVIAALLEDAMHRIDMLPELSERLSLVKVDANQYLLDEGAKKPGTPVADVIYLDPMFPHKKKSALVKKEMRAFQQLLGTDMDSSQLLQTALNYAGQRVVVKRPSYAEPIDLASGRMPNTAIESKKHRFDVYIQH